MGPSATDRVGDLERSTGARRRGSEPDGNGVAGPAGLLMDEEGAIPLPDLSCSDVTNSGKPCGNEIEWGLCGVHRDRLQRRLEQLAELEERETKCREQTKTGNPCTNDAVQWGLCEIHKEHLEKEVLKGLVQEAPRVKNPERPTYAPRPQLPPMSPEEARAHLQAILDRRTRIPAHDEVYTIPFEELEFQGRRAKGPSLVAGDDPVWFQYIEKNAKGETVLCYGAKGSMAGRDMPIASRPLFVEMMHCLKYLPGYRDRCEHTGEPLRVPLGVIAYKLLRGAITIDQIRFPRFSPQGKRQLQQKEADEQLKIGRKLLRLSPIEMARDLMDGGFQTPEVVRILRTLWLEDATDEEMGEVIRVAEEEANPI